MADIVLLDSRSTWAPPHAGRPWADRLDVVDVYDLPTVDLARYAGVVVEGMVDQQFLHAKRDVVAAGLGGGGVVVWSGQLFRPWLPGCAAFVATTITTFGDYAVKVVGPHPVFAGVDPDDLTFRRGIAGFFARGHHPPPAGAEIVLALAGGDPVVYVDRQTTKGTVLAHAGGGLLGWAHGAVGPAGTPSPKPSTAERIDGQLLDWIVAEAGRR